MVVFGFDPDPGASPKGALHVLTVDRALPGGAVDAQERFAESALGYVVGAGVGAGGRRGKGKGGNR